MRDFLIQVMFGQYVNSTKWGNTVYSQWSDLKHVLTETEPLLSALATVSYPDATLTPS